MINTLCKHVIFPYYAGFFLYKPFKSGSECAI